MRETRDKVTGSPMLREPVEVSMEPGAREAARRLLEAEAEAVGQLVGRLDEAFDRAVELIVGCADRGGTVVLTGLGKSGLIGAKISATLASIGIPSYWIHPTDAVHGDLGRFRPGDVCIALSYSGQTDEVVALASALRQDGVPIISLTRGPADDGTPNALERVADARVTIGNVDSTHDLSPAPMCSTTATAAMGDALALAASVMRRFTVDDFAKRHPGGTLGGMLRPIGSILRWRVGQNLDPVPSDQTVREALETAESADRRPGALLVVNADGRLAGILTDADIRRLMLRRPELLGERVDAVMTPDPISLREDALVRDGENLVRQRRLDEIPVVDEAGRPVGLLDVQDLVTKRVTS